MAYKALDIANKIISKTDLEHGDTISNLKLQKMMYYQQGFHLAYNELIRKGRVTRDYINQEVDKRCSSGIVLILGQIPFVSTVRNPTSLEI